MALQTPLSQEQLIAQALGSASASGMNSGIPGMGGLPAPTGMPGSPAMDPQLIAQALGAGATPQVNPLMQASGADQLVAPGSFGDYLVKLRQWKECQMNGMGDCGPQPTMNPAPTPTGT